MLYKIKNYIIEMVLSKRLYNIRYQGRKSKKGFIIDKWWEFYFVYKKLGQKIRWK